MVAEAQSGTPVCLTAVWKASRVRRGRFQSGSVWIGLVVCGCAYHCLKCSVIMSCTAVGEVAIVPVAFLTTSRLSAVWYFLPPRTPKMDVRTGLSFPCSRLCSRNATFLFMLRRRSVRCRPCMSERSALIWVSHYERVGLRWRSCHQLRG